MNKVRTRFAPSPTGFLHVGGIRTALFAWLLAKNKDGEFILRIEDTDQAREVGGSVDHIQKSLEWLGLEWNEGPGKEGSHGPYLQSKRLDLYKEWAHKLIELGRAYADPYSAEEVQAFREQARANNKPFLFRNHRPENPPAWDGTTPLRFKSEPGDQPINWDDAVMGSMHAGPEVVDDFILIKSDGFPTYNFAHIIDDHLMEISHVIRGQEFLASMPNYLNLYEALGFEKPVFATMPHILGPDGNKKLSKRDGAKDILDYQKEGYLPEAMRNFLASLGWNDGTEQEVYSTDELIAKFSLEKVQSSSARFDERRLLWLNGSHIRELDVEQLYELTEAYWPPNIPEQYSNKEYKLRVLGLVQERLKYFAELPTLSNFFFEDLPIDDNLIESNKQLKKIEKSELKDLLIATETALKDSDFSEQDLTEKLNHLLETTQQKPAVLFSLIRIATTQAAASPGLADSMACLGKDRCLNRIKAQISAL